MKVDMDKVGYAIGVHSLSILYTRLGRRRPWTLGPYWAHRNLNATQARIHLSTRPSIHLPIYPSIHLHPLLSPSLRRAPVVREVGGGEDGHAVAERRDALHAATLIRVGVRLRVKVRVRLTIYSC